MRLEEILQVVKDAGAENAEIIAFSSLNNDTVSFTLHTKVDIKTKDKHISSIQTSWHIDDCKRVFHCGGSYTCTHKEGAEVDFSFVDKQVKLDREKIENLL